MSGRKLINADYNVSTDWEDETESKQFLKYGLNNIEWDDLNSVLSPTIKAGSVIDVGGVFYVFDSDYIIPVSANAGNNYIRLLESGGVLIGEVTTTDYLAFDVLQQGYYNPGSSRYVMGYYYSGGDYQNKYLFTNEDLYIKIRENFTARESVNKIQTFKNTSGNFLSLTLGSSGTIIKMNGLDTCAVIYTGSEFVRIDGESIKINHYTSSATLQDIGIGYTARTTFSSFTNETLTLPAGGTFKYSYYYSKDLTTDFIFSAFSDVVAGGTVIINPGANTNVGIVFYERLT